MLSWVTNIGILNIGSKKNNLNIRQTQQSTKHPLKPRATKHIYIYIYIDS